MSEGEKENDRAYAIEFSKEYQQGTAYNRSILQIDTPEREWFNKVGKEIREMHLRGRVFVNFSNHDAIDNFKN